MPVMRLTETEGRVEGGEPVPVLRKEDNLKVDEGKDHGLSEFDFREEKRQQLSPGSGYIRDVGRHPFRADKRPPSVEADQGSAVSGEGRMAVKNFAVIKEHHGIEKNHAARSSGEPHSSSKQLHRPFSSPASTPSTPYSIPPSNPYSSSIPSPYSTPSTISSSLPPAPFSIPLPHPSLVPVSHPSIPSSLPYTLPAFTSTPSLKQQASIPSSLTASVIPSANPHFAPYASQPGPRGPTPPRPATIGLAPPGSSPGAPPRPLPPAGGQPPYRSAPGVAVQPRPPMAGQTTPQFHQGVFNPSRPTKGGLTPPRVSNAPLHIRQSGAGANPVQHTAYEVKPLPEAAMPLNFSNKIQPNASDLSDSRSEPKSSLDHVAASGPVPVRIPLLSGAKVPRQGGPDHYMSGISSAGQQVKNEHSDIKPAAAVKTEVKEEKPEVGAPWFPGASRQSGSLLFKVLNVFASPVHPYTNNK